MCSASVFGPVIHVAVPSATSPANSSMAVPRAATITCGGADTSTSSGPADALTVSPFTRTLSWWSSGIRIARYSRIARSG